GTYKAWFGLGNASEELGDYRTALEAYERALKSCPVLSGAAHRLASILLKVTDSDKVRTAMERLTDLSHPSVLMALAIAFREARLYSAALDYVRKGIAFGPNIALQTLRGELELYSGQYEAAVATFAELTNCQEASPAVRTFAALASLMLGRIREAETLLESAAGLPGESGRAWVFRQFAALLEGRPPELLRATPGSTEHRPVVEAVWTLLAFLLERQEFEKFELAINLLDLVEPVASHRHLQLGKLYSTFGFGDSAIEELGALSPGELDAEAAEILGNLCEERGLKEEALSFFATALERDPKNPRRYAVLAVKARAAGETELSVDTAQRGLADFPDHPILRQVLAQAG
ncbi:MAG: tetratricopeptide repeat protein, partial [Methanocella sp.]